MADYFLDDAANGTNDGASWETCYNTWAQVNTAAILTAANRLIVGADANITDPGAALTITGPTSSKPAVIISSTVGSGTAVAYSVGTGTQVDTNSGAYDITFDGAFALYGLRIVAGKTIVLGTTSPESVYCENCAFVHTGGANYQALNLGGAWTSATLIDCSLDFTADGTNTRTEQVIVGSSLGRVHIFGMTFAGNGYRTGYVFGAGAAQYASSISGCDFSGFTSATVCEIVDIGSLAGSASITNCLTAATWTPVTTGTPRSGGSVTFTNCGPADATTYLMSADYRGTLVSAPIYRTGGATVETEATSWLITTTANCSEGSPFYTPWMYGTASSAVSTHFDVCYVHDSVAPISGALADNSEIWLEVEYLATADEANWTLASNHRVITDAAAAHTTDSSTWNGTGPSFTYKGLLRKTVTIGETGQYRARVCVGVASITSSAYLYIDPKVTLTAA